MLDGGEVTRLKDWPIASFLVMQRGRSRTGFYSPLRIPPTAITNRARAGDGVELGRHITTWVLDGDEVSGYTFYIDHDLDGDLSNETPTKLELHDGVWRAVVSAEGATSNNAPTSLKFSVALSGSEIFVEYMNRRVGSVTYLGRTLGVTVVGAWGYYGMGAEIIYFDAQGDEQKSLFNRDKVVTLWKKPFRFDVSDSGDTVTLTPIDHEASPIQHAVRGKLVPEFRVDDIDGHRSTVRDLNGSYVLLDFWSMYCSPCVSEIPEIGSLLASTSHLAVIGVTQDEDNDVLKAFVISHRMGWPIVSGEQSDRIHSIFYVDRYPTYELLDPSGIVVCSGCSLSQVRGILHPQTKAP